MVTPERSSETIKRLVEAFNRHDAAATGQLHASVSVVFDPGHPDPLQGRAAIEREAADWFAAAPDVDMVIERLWASEEGASDEMVMSGTQSGVTGDRPASNRSFRQTAVATWRFNKAGEITEERRYYDPADIMRQLGIGS